MRQNPVSDVQVRIGLPDAQRHSGRLRRSADHHHPEAEAVLAPLAGHCTDLSWSGSGRCFQVRAFALVPASMHMCPMQELVSQAACQAPLALNDQGSNPHNLQV